MVAYLALQVPAIQTLSAKKAARVVSERLNTEVSIGKVYFVFFNRLIAKDISIITGSTDTLLHCGKISVKFSASDLLRKNRVKLTHLTLSDGQFNILNETDSTTNLGNFLTRAFGQQSSDSAKGSSDIFVRRLKLENFHFSLYNPFFTRSFDSDAVVNFLDLSVSNINIDVKNIFFNSDTLTAGIENITFTEKSGLKSERFRGDLKIAKGLMQLNNLSYSDGFTNLNTNRLSFIYSQPGAFDDFLNDVRIEADFNNTFLNFKTLSKFAPGLASNSLSFYINGFVSGPVSNLRTENLKITSESGLTYLDINARIAGLPDIEETMAFVDINNSTTTTSDIAFIISSLNNTKPADALSNLSPFVKYNFRGRLAGLLDDFVANGTLNSNIGQLYVDVLLRNNIAEDGFDFIGYLKSDKFNVGKLVKSSVIGELTLNTYVSALLRDEASGGSKFFIDSILIRELNFNNYPYRNINAAGSYQNNTFDGRVICRDPNLDFIFQGLIGLSSKSDSYYDFFADVIYADLAALNFDKRDSISTVSLRTLANFTQNTKGDIEGTINIRGLSFTNSKGVFPIGDINILSSTGQDNFEIVLKSSFANASYKGNDFFTNFIDKFFNITLASNLPAVFPKKWGNNGNKPESKNGNSYLFTVDFNDTRAVSQLILPGLTIAEKSNLKISIDKRENVLMIINSNKLGYKNIYSQNLNLVLKGDSRNAECTVTSDKIHLFGLILDSSRVKLGLNDNLLAIRSEYTNQGDLENRMNFTSNILFTSMGESLPSIVDVTINPSELYLNGVNWSIGKSKIVVQDSTYVFHDFNIHRQNQLLSIDGIISSNPFDTLFVKVRDLDVSPFNSFISTPLDIKGVLNGDAVAVNLYKEPMVLVDIQGTDVSMSRHKLGDLKINSEWDNVSNQFLLSLSNRLGEREPLNINGYYKPSDNLLGLKIALDNFSPAYFEPFLEEILSGFSGGISGNLSLEGPPDKLNLTSTNSVLNNVSFLVDYTNVRYTVRGPVLFTPLGVTFSNVMLTDRNGNRGRVNGGIYYDNFKDLRINTLITFNNIEALNLREQDNVDFYGNAFGTGRVTIAGPLEKILIDINVTTNRNTAIHIPLSASSDVSRNNLLTFIQPSTGSHVSDDIYDDLYKTRSGTELQVKLSANMTPDAAMLIEIDKTVGDVITGYGTGLITLDINPSRDIFSIQGDYIIQSGFYKFVLQGFFERDFTIQEGGNISFNGDIARTNLNITANYRTKASVNTLIADTSSVSSRRNVDCQIRMVGPLLNPGLTFSIDIPDIDPVTKARVDAALNTDDKVVKQVMSLLVSGSFIPDVQSSIVNNSTILYSNATEVLSNQINKIFSQLDIPLDLSFNYQPGQNGRDIFDAAVSAQLFNNRVIVNGNIGSARYTDKRGDVTGDLDVEIKLDDRGRFRAKAFSHSADQYSNYLDNSQRNGIGLVYQEEFSSFKELFNSLFTNRRRRERRISQESAQ